MNKHNLFKISLSAVILITALLYTGCRKEPKRGGPVPKISFDISNADAVAGLADTQNRSARAADSKALLQKILENGSVESAMDIDGNSFGENLSYIDYVILPPENVASNDVYLFMNDYSTAEVNVDGDTKNWYLGPLICIHEDNTYDDVFLESPYDLDHFYKIDYKENVQFLKDGSIVCLFRGGGYKHFLNKWNPVTKQTTQLCSVDLPIGEGSLFVRAFSINKNEDYFYLYLDRVESDGTGYQYIKIINQSDSSFDKEISKEFPGVTGWCYSPYDDKLYYSKGSTPSEPDTGTYKADKTGSNPDRLTGEVFDQLIPVSAQKVWAVQAWDGGKFTLQNILSDHVEIDTGDNIYYKEAFTYYAPEHYIFDGDYIFANGSLYLRHCLYDSTSGHKDAIIAVPLNGTNSDIKNLLGFNLNIQVHSWSVNETSLFIAGSDYETKEAVNCKIDLNTGAKVDIKSDSTFGAIAAL